MCTFHLIQAKDIKFWEVVRGKQERSEMRNLLLFMQGTNLLIYYLFDFVLYFNAIYVYYDNCIWFGNYALVCELVYFTWGWH